MNISCYQECSNKKTDHRIEMDMSAEPLKGIQLSIFPSDRLTMWGIQREGEYVGRNKI